MPQSSPTRRTIYRCTDCHAIVGTDPLRWYLDSGLWQPLCYDDWFARLAVEQKAAAAWASVECRVHGYMLDAEVQQ